MQLSRARRLSSASIVYQGETLDEVRANLREAAEGWLAVAHEDGVARAAAGETP